MENKELATAWQEGWNHAIARINGKPWGQNPNSGLPVGYEKHLYHANPYTGEGVVDFDEIVKAKWVKTAIEWYEVKVRRIPGVHREPFPHKLPTPEVGLMVIDGPHGEEIAQWIANTRYDVRIWNTEPAGIYESVEEAREKAVENGTLDIYLSHEDDDVKEGCRTGGFFKDVPDMVVYADEVVECTRFVGHDPKSFYFDTEYLPELDLEEDDDFDG